MRRSDHQAFLESAFFPPDGSLTVMAALAIVLRLIQGFVPSSKEGLAFDQRYPRRY